MQKAKKQTPPLTILVDIREQLPYNFSSFPCNVEVALLPTGDYSVKGENGAPCRICIERKSKEDFFSSISQRRMEFEEELRRMISYDYAALVIEATMEDLLIPLDRSQLNPLSARNTAIFWCMKYDVQLFCCKGRVEAEKLVFDLLQKFHTSEGDFITKPNFYRRKDLNYLTPTARTLAEEKEAAFNKLIKERDEKDREIKKIKREMRKILKEGCMKSALQI